MSTTTSRSKRLNLVTSLAISIVAFALWQVYDLIMLWISPPSEVIYLLFLAIPIAIIISFFLFIKLIKSTSEEQGYRKPTTIKTSKCLVMSLIFILVYLLVYLFPAITTGGYSFTGLPADPLLTMHRIASAILFGLATESVFRGYVFRNLVKSYGFFTSLYASSLLFVLYQLSIRDIMSVVATFDDFVTYAFTTIFPTFAAGLFLGFFFYKTGWSLLGPVTFSIGVRFLLDPFPIVSIPSPPWWMALTVEAISYVILIFVVDSIIKEPQHLRRRYGLEG